MKKNADLKKASLDFLEKELTSNGFTLSQQSFYRKISIGEQILHISFIKKRHEVEIKANVDIRHNDLERLYNTLLGESPDTPTATVGAEIGKLSGVKSSMVWSVKDLLDVPMVGNDILSNFRDVGLPFAEKYASLEKIYEILVADDPPAQSFCPIPHIRAKKSILASYLLGQYDNYDDLVNAKLEYLLSIKNPYVADFRDFANKLREKIKMP